MAGAMKEHDAPTDTAPRRSDAREERISRRLSLIGEGPASFFRDACRIMSGADGLEAQTHLVAHCIREIESALRAVLRAVVVVGEADPQKKHRAEITAILTALDFAAEDHVSTAWLDIVDQEQYGLHRLAHRDSLRAPRRIDKDFENFWDRMLNVLDAVTAKVEDRFLHWLPKLDVLAAKDLPTQKDAQFVLTQAPSNNVTLGHFFDQLSNPAWIEPLHNEGFFQHPPRAEREGDYIRFPFWPESRYLARVAGSAPQKVLEIALALPETDNVRVFEDFAEAALLMPAELAAQIVPKAKQWAASPHHLLLPDKLGILMSYLARGGQAGPALDLVAAALEVLPDPRRAEPDGDEIEKIIVPAPEPRGRFSEWDYRRVLGHIPALVEADGVGTLDILIGLLGTAIDLSAREPDPEKPDLSYIWRPAIEDHDQNMAHGIKHPLVDALRDAALTIASRDDASLRWVIDALEARPSSVFRRIALHVLRLVPIAPTDLLVQRITDRDLLDDTSIHHEFWLLAHDRVGDLPEAERSSFFASVDAGPDRADLKGTLERWKGEPVTDEDVDRHVNDWKLRRLTIMEDVLPPDLGKTLVGLRQEGVAPEHPEFISYMGELKAGPSSPVDDAYLRGLDQEDLIQFLKEWQPGGEWMGPSPEGLGRHLEALVRADPERFAVEAERFKGLDPTYVRGVVSGLEQAHKGRTVFSWEPVLNLCRWVVEQPREISGREAEYSDLDPGWVWTRKAIASLLGQGFSSGPNEIPIALREAAWSALHPIADDADPTPEDEDRFGGDNMDPPTLSINTTRGEAMHSVIKYGFWVHRHLNPSEGDATSSFDDMPEVREVLDAHLGPDRDPSLAIRSVYGEWLPWLILMDRAWSEHNLTKIFPGDGALAEYRDAAWDAYIWRCRPYDASFEVLGEEYMKATDRIASRERNERDRTDPDENLAEHVMTYYWQGKLPLDDGSNLLGRFYSKAPAELRASALEFVGRSIRNTGADVLDGILDRLMRLWEWRLDDAATLEAEERRKELAAFGWWFAAEAFPEDWAIAQLERALTVGGGIDADHLVAERIGALSKRHPREAMVCMRLMAEGDDQGWGIIGWREEARSAISTAMASEDPEARRAAEALVNYLGTRGHLEFRDLLADPQA